MTDHNNPPAPVAGDTGADAEMLDWLIKNQDATVCSDGAYGLYHVWFRYSNRTTEKFKTPREAIRAAMATTQEAPQ